MAGEMHELELAEMRREDVLLAATRDNAQLLGLSDIGTIEAGKIADLAIFGADPLDDLRAIRDVRYIISAGTVFTPSTLLTTAAVAPTQGGPS